MSLFHLILVALVQGITEFLPVSSSGHLVLISELTPLPDQGLAIDVAVHVGTLGAVIAYFWADVRVALRGVLDVAARRQTPAARLALCLVVATIPAMALGLIIKLTGLDEAMRSTLVIGVTMLVFGVVLYWADQRGETRRQADDWTVRHAWIMGLWQALALIPGTSRSGITITAARHLGYTREDGAKLAMLMSIPTILASGALLSLDVIGAANWALARDAAIGAALAFVSAFVALALMMRLLRSVSFTPYVIYRVVLGAILIAVAVI